MADKQLYEVESIHGKKLIGSRVHYLVHWRGFTSDHDTWEPRANLDSCKPLIKIFKDKVAVNNNEKASLHKNTYLLGSRSQDNSTMTPAASVDQILSITKKKPGGVMKHASPLSLNARKRLRLRNSAEGLIQKSFNLSHKGKKKRNTIGSTEIFSFVNNGKKQAVRETSLEEMKDGRSGALPKQAKVIGSLKSSSKVKQSHAMKKNLFSCNSVNKNLKNDNTIAQMISDDEETNDEDDDVLYSINLECDTINVESDESQEMKDDLKHKKSNQMGRPPKGPKDDGKSHKPKKIGRPPKGTTEKKNFTLKEKDKQNGGKKKRMSLMESKKNSKDWISKSGLFRSVSPPPQFTSVKHIFANLNTEDPSKPSGNSLPDPVSPEASETYLADVPSSYPVPAEEPVTDSEEQPLSTSSLMYRSFLNSLPMQLHPVVTDHKLDKKSSVRSGSSSSTSGPGLLTRGVGGETVERRISVRSSECAFRYKQIVVKKCFRYTQIWLNTQTVMRNALNPQVIQEMVSALNSAKYDDSHLVLLSSLGNVFCSGTDLHFLISNDRKVAARQMADSIRELTKTFITFPKPVIAAVSGAAVGMGVSLLALCDVVYASDKASFHLPYSQLSQTPEGSSSFTLPLTLGLPSANELLYGGRKITAMEAYQLGLVSQVFWPTLMMQEVIPRAENMATSSAKALEATKLLIRSHHRTKMELTNETECNLLLERWLSADCQRAIETYLSNEKNLSF